jgi:predicted RNA-binding protein with PIN domain
VDDEPQAEPRTLVVDGNNVVGARPDGWWRDRRGASRRLLERLQCYRPSSDAEVVVIFDVPHPDLPEGDHDGVTVLYARRRGRDAADERILEFLDTRARARPEGSASEEPRVEVVTSDRALADGARHRRASVTGAGVFLSRLDQAGC